MYIKEKSLTLLLVPIMCGLVLAGCGGRSEESGRSPSGGTADSTGSSGLPEQGDTLVTNLANEPGHLNPAIGNDGYATEVTGHIFSTILNVDNETMEFIPHVAERWEISEDNLTYTFFLREDAVFSDGVPLTAEDIEFSYDIIMDPASDTAPIRNYYADIETVEILDPLTIRFNMKKPYFRHIIVLGLMEVMPKHIYGEGDFNTHPNNRNPVGSGPYKFEKWDTGQQIVLARNENYFLDWPHVDKRVFKFISDENASFQVLERHELDEMRMQPELWVTRGSRPSFEAEFNKFTPNSPSPGTLSRYNYIGWNMRKPMFQDKRVRRALTMLFDRELIIETVWHGLGTLITGGMPYDSPEYDHSIEPWPFDPEAAKKLLDEAGWVDSDRDGVREKDGVPFEFELSYGAGLAEYNQLTAVYQEELKRAGISMSLNPLEWAAFLERVYDRSFDANMMAWVTPMQQDLYQLWHSTMAPSGSNHPGFIRDDVDKILEDFRIEFDPEKRAKLYHRLHAILHEEQPYTFLYARPGLVAVDKRFQDVKVYDLGLDPLEWWVAKEARLYR